MAKAKAKPADDIDELEAELAQLEEVEIDEDDEDTEDEGVDLSSMTAAQLKVHAKSLGIKGTDKKNKAALIALIEAHDDEDEEDEEEEDEVEEEVEEEEEDEDDGLDEMSRADLKAHIKAEGLEVKVFKSDSDEDIVAKIREATGDDEDDEEEEEDEPAPKKAASKGKGKAPAKKGGAKKGSLGPRPLPAGRFGANDVAEAAGTTALAVRNFLRSDKGQAWPINAEIGRYSFTAKQVSAIVKAMASRPGAGPRGPRSKTTGKASTKKGTRK